MVLHRSTFSSSGATVSGDEDTKNLIIIMASSTTALTVGNPGLEQREPKKILVNFENPEKVLPKTNEVSEILQRSIHFIALIGSTVGYATRYDWKSNNGRFMFMKSIIIFVWILMFYTQFLYIYQRAISRIYEVFTLYGIGMSHLLKFRCFEKYFKRMTALINSTIRICQQSTGHQAKKLKERVEENFLFYKCMVTLAGPIILLYLYYPVKSYIFDGKFQPLVPLEIMFVDQATMLGFCIANFIMGVGGIISVLGSVFIGMTFVIIIMNYVLRVDILEANFNELDIMWNDAFISKASTTTIPYRHMFLRNMCLKFVDMRQYVIELKTIYDQKLFIFFIFAYLSQILCLYQIRVSDWVSGYALAIGFFLEMIFYCIMGTKLSLENERLLYIVSQSKWYTYDIQSQKMIIILLNLAINSVELWIGPFKPLNVLTATEMVRSVFSYYTILMEVVG